MPATYHIQTITVDPTQESTRVDVYPGWAQVNNAAFPDANGQLRVFVGYEWNPPTDPTPFEQPPIQISIVVQDVDVDHPFDSSLNMVGAVQLSDGTVKLVWNSYQ